MTSSPESIALDFLTAVSERDLDAALGLTAPGAHIDIPPVGLHGLLHESGRAFLAHTFTAFPDLRLPVRRLFGTESGPSGVRVVAEATFEGTQAADWLGIVNQKKHVDVDQVWVLKVDGDRIADVNAYWDQNQIYRRLAVKRLDQVTIAVPGGHS